MATISNIKPQYNDILYYANDEFDESLTITDESGDPVDLSGKTLTFVAKKRKTDSTAVVDISTASEITISGADNNVVTFSGTYDLIERGYHYDLTNTDDDLTLSYGLFIVTEDV